MKIKSTRPIKGFWIDVLDGAETYNYVRYAADSWMVRVGESYESIYMKEEKELEKLFQEYMRVNAD